MSRLTRRRFIQQAAATVPVLALSPSLRAWQSAGSWAQADAIVRGITLPTFPGRTFDITAFGAVADGMYSCTGAIRKAIAACGAAGGGRVIVPNGRFLTGAIRLESNVNLHLEDCTFDGVERPDVLENVKEVELKKVRVNGEHKNGVISSR